jgi:hypothetical protein
MAIIIKAFTKNPEDDWSGIVRSSGIPAANAAATLAKVNVDALLSSNVETTHVQVSENEYHIRYKFPSITALVNFVETYHDRDENKQWRQKLDSMMTNNKIPVYKKLIIITDDDGNEVAQETLFANTAILRKI